jgi:hypothetical protein
MTTTHNCKSEDCEAHRFVMELIQDIKDSSSRRDDSYHDLKENVIVLTQNVMEMQRMSARFDRLLEELKEQDSEQDKKIDKNRDFVIKAGAVVGAITFVAAMTPLLTMLVKH